VLATVSAFHTDHGSPLVDSLDEMPNISHLPAGLGWREIPLVGPDGEITGVLCQGFSVGIPSRGPGYVENDSKELVHDIANLLAVIEGGLRSLDNRTEEERTAIVVRLRGAVERGTALSRRFLDADQSRLGPLHAPICHRQIVDIRDLLDRTLRQDVSVRAEVDPGLRQFRADPDELHLALLNLCKNSSDAMPKGGRISISARNVYARPEDPWVEIAVADEGTGMPVELVSRIFEPYFTTKAAGKGTGLGLPQVKRFVERYGGAVRVESVENEGTVVRLLFPCA
jgi:signal transduction histidine kinase